MIKTGKSSVLLASPEILLMHKLMQEELRKNEERFRKIFEESQFGIMLSDPDFRL